MRRLGELAGQLLEFKRLKAPVKTFFPEGTMSKSAEAIYKVAISKKYAPNGIASAIAKINYYAGRAGSNISAKQRAEIEKAKDMLSARIDRDNAKKKANKKG